MARTTSCFLCFGLVAFEGTEMALSISAYFTTPLRLTLCFAYSRFQLALIWNLMCSASFAYAFRVVLQSVDMTNSFKGVYAIDLTLLSVALYGACVSDRVMHSTICHGI